MQSSLSSSGSDLRRRTLVQAVPVVFLVLLTSGCCSVFLGRRQGVTFNSYPPGAAFTVDGEEHRTPVRVPLWRGGTYRVTLHKDGYMDHTVTFTKKLHPLVWLSFYCCVVPGIADVALGSAFQQVPDTILVGLRTVDGSVDPALAPPPVPPADPRPALAVWQLSPQVGVDPKLMAPLTEALRVALGQAERCAIQARGEMEKVMREQRIALSTDCDTTACAIEYGQMLSVRKIVVGSVAKIGGTYQVVARLIDVAGGVEERSVSSRRSGSEDVLFVLVDEAAEKLLAE